MEGAIGSGLFEAFDGSIHGLSCGSKGAAGQHLDLLRVLDFGASVNDFLSSLEEFLGEVPELQHFSLDEGVSQLLYGAVDNRLVGLSVLKNALSKGMKRGLRTIARSCSQLNREHRMSFTHGKVGPGARVVEYESHIFGLAFVIVSVVNWHRDAESSVRLILDKRRPWMCVARGVIDKVLVCTGYYNQGRGRPDAVCE